MKRFAIAAMMSLAFVPQIALAQMNQPYAGLQTRPIKSLSDQEVADLRAGRGMGLALAAELNGYPGPAHVVDLAGSLGLSASQQARMRTLLAAMKAETIPIGERLIAAESSLNSQFAGKTITETSLRSAMQEISAIQAELRAAHLKYHLVTATELTPMQIQRYAELRGYSEEAHVRPSHGGHKH